MNIIHQNKLFVNGLMYNAYGLCLYMAVVAINIAHAPIIALASG